MRNDLAKLTTERERRGSNGISKKYGGRVRIVHDPEHDYEDEVGGFHSSARRRVWGYDAKEFSDVLNPLLGNLRKNVGRPWNDVFSEFCACLDRRSNSGYHIYTHLMMEVTTNAFFQNGILCHRTRYGWIRKVYGYYVHPETGLLQYEPVKRRHKKEKPITKINLEGGSWFERENDLWYHCHIEENHDKKSLYFEGTHCYEYLVPDYVIKRQCGKKDLRLIRSWINGTYRKVKKQEKRGGRRV